MFRDFFQKKDEGEPDSKKQRYGFMEDSRVEIFRSAAYPHQRLQEGVWSKLTGEVYKMTAHHQAVVLAVYKDQTILWLDDHTSNFDFETFIQREQLLMWLPEQRDGLLALLMMTKFNFLGRPRLITTVSDVPDISKRAEESLLTAYGQKGAKSILEARNRLAEVADQVHPPLLESQPAGFQLQFYIWTKMLGKVIRINCFLGADSSFNYEALLLTEQVGFYGVPR